MAHGDDNGLVLPPLVAPIQVVIVPIAQQKPGVIPAAREIYQKFVDAGFRTKLDESDHTPGWKFSEYEMKGIPLRVEVGPRDIEKGVVVLAKRNDGVKVEVKMDEMIESAKALMDKIQKEMYEKAYRYLLDHITEVHSIDELKAALEKGGYAKMMWCGEEECENQVKEMTTATARCLPFNQTPFDDTCPICGKKAKKLCFLQKHIKVFKIRIQLC